MVVGETGAGGTSTVCSVGLGRTGGDVWLTGVLGKTSGAAQSIVTDGTFSEENHQNAVHSQNDLKGHHPSTVQNCRWLTTASKPQHNQKRVPLLSGCISENESAMLSQLVLACNAYSALSSGHHTGWYCWRH